MSKDISPRIDTTFCFRVIYSLICILVYKRKNMVSRKGNKKTIKCVLKAACFVSKSKRSDSIT